MRAKRAKIFGAFLGVLQGKITKKRLFLRFQIGKKWTFGRPGFWKYQNPDSNIWPDFENMKTLFQKFGRKITKGGGFNIITVVVFYPHCVDFSVPPNGRFFKPNT